MIRAGESQPDFTPRQGQYLAFIYAYTLVNGRPPAQADMQRFFRVTPPTVHQMLLALERAGLISRQPGVARCVTVRIERDRQKFAGAGEAGFACRGGEQAVVANAMEPARQDVKQEAADELVDAERHDLLAVCAMAAIILVAEGDAGLVESEQPPVRDRDSMSIAREIGEHGVWAGEGGLA